MSICLLFITHRLKILFYKRLRTDIALSVRVPVLFRLKRYLDFTG